MHAIANIQDLKAKTLKEANQKKQASSITDYNGESIPIKSVEKKFFSHYVDIEAELIEGTC